MLGISQIMPVVIVLILNINTYGNRDEKLKTDLIGNSVQSTDEEQYWTFRNGEPLEYALLEKKSIGVQKAKRLYTTIYIRTRNKENEPKRQFAEGIIEIVYMKSRSGSSYFISHINQLGFKIKELTPEIEIELNELENFWKEFRYSVAYDIKEKVADMIEYPLATPHFGIYPDKEKLLKNYDTFFNTVIKTSIENSILVPAEKPKGKSFDYSNDEYEQLSDYESALIFGDNIQYFVVKKVNGRFKVTGVREKY